MILPALLAGGFRPVSADSFEEAVQQYESHLSGGRVQDAIPFAKKALAIAKEKRAQGDTGCDDVVYVTLLKNLGMAFVNAGDPKQADEYLAEAASTAEVALGENSPEFMSALSTLAANRRRLGDIHSAGTLHDRAVELSVKHLDRNDSLRSSILNNAGVFHSEQQHFAEAESLIRESLEIERHQESGADGNPRIFDRLMKLGIIQLGRLECQSALQSFKAVLEVLDDMPGDQQAQRIECAYFMGLAWSQMGNPENAEPLMKPGYAAAKETERPGSAKLITRAVNYGSVLATLGRTAEATAVLSNIPLDKLDSTPTDLSHKIVALTAHSRVLVQERQLADARQAIEKALSIAGEHPNACSPLVQINLDQQAAHVYAWQRDSQKADSHFFKALRLATKAYGEDSMHVRMMKYEFRKVKDSTEPRPQRQSQQLLRPAPTAWEIFVLPIVLLVTNSTFLFLLIFCFVARFLTGKRSWLRWVYVYGFLFIALTLADLFYWYSGKPEIKTIYLATRNPLFILGPICAAAFAGLKWCVITAFTSLRRKATAEPGRQEPPRAGS